MAYATVASKHIGNAMSLNTNSANFAAAPAGGDWPDGFAMSSGDDRIGSMVAVKGSDGSTYPTVAGVNGGSDNTNATSHTVNLPASVVSGDLLLGIFSVDGNPTVSWPMGWTKLGTDASDGANVTQSLAYRIANGSEGATITVGTSGSEAQSHTVYRIQNYSGTPHVSSSRLANGTSIGTLLQLPPCKPAWVGPSLFFAIGTTDSTPTVSSYPTNYTDGRNDAAAGTNAAGTGSSRRQINVADSNGRLLIVGVASLNNDALSWPGGWAPVCLGINLGGMQLDVRQKIGDGTEGDFVVTGTSSRGSSFAYSLDDHGGRAIGAGSRLPSASFAVPPTPSLGFDIAAADCLVVSIMAWLGTGTVSDTPSGFSNFMTAQGNASTVGIIAGEREVNGAFVASADYTIGSARSLGVLFAVPPLVVPPPQTAGAPFSRIFTGM